ncbi:MAG: hypothetical protein WDN75_04415 [Bacteroidota bacterium]
MQRLIFEYSPVYFLLCLALGVGYALLLYSSKYTWSKSLNRALFALRAVLATTLLLLLLGPILKQTENMFEKPTVVFLVDNSRSIKETADSARVLTALRQADAALKKNNRETEWSSLTGSSDSIYFNGSSSDLASALRETINRYEGKNLAGIVLASDGIYNNGVLSFISSFEGACLYRWNWRHNTAHGCCPEKC